eukprot:TRINITY_DN55869_c0_g1_i1.p1 TRINITY_DN55869_c0_g1~~TRINITY_DN55869_c0_g1_i1.p1  ORF type:complete len:434 (-),score=92.98 TRINITY_DN55869_c0_g1_i1:92-1393(-)
MGGLLSTDEDSPLSADSRPRGPMLQLGPANSSWAVPRRYEIRKLLGRGAYGSVCEAYDQEKDVVIAIKQCKRLFEELTDCKRVLRELAILQRLSHPNVVRVHDIIVPVDINTFNELCVVLEKCDMDLKKYIKMDVTLELWQVNTLFCNLLLGLQYIHRCDIIHRDLKPANCLFNASDGVVKICDFGLARSMGGELPPLPNTPRGDSDDPEETEVPLVHSSKSKKRVMTKHVVTRWYRAPELAITPGEYTAAIDVWSSGCIYAELLQMLPDGEDYMERGPLFPGSSCFPLSPARTQARRARTRGQHDQLEVIFDVIGTPTKEELAQLGPAEAAAVKEFNERPGKGIESQLPYASKEATGFLTQMLRFNPRVRCNVDVALQAPIMTAIRPYDNQPQFPGVRVELAFEQEKNLSEKLLRKYYDEEIKRFHTLAGTA